MTRKTVTLILIVLAFCLFAGCAPGPNEVAALSNSGELAGFWLGLGHGLICGITFIISLFSDKVNVYEVYNNGGWYNFGFVLGACILYGGGGSSSSRRRRS